MPTFKQLANLVLFLIALLATEATSQAQWTQTTRHSDIGYFLFAAPARVERYSFVNRQWLAPIPLTSVYGLPTALAVDETRLYIAYDRTVKRYDLTGGNEFHMLNTGEAIQALHIDGNLLLVARAFKITTFDKGSGSGFASLPLLPSISGSSIARSRNKIIARTAQSSPSDICQIRYSDNGKFISQTDSPHHGDYPSALQTWVFPNDTKVVDNSGTVYSAGDLSYLNTFGGTITDLDFHGNDVPILLRGSNVVSYSNALMPMGSQLLHYAPSNIYVFETNVLTFTPDTNQNSGIRVDAIALDSLNAPTPDLPVDPAFLPYTPDLVFLDTNSVLYLFSRAHQSLFRWDTTNQAYLPTIALDAIPTYITYSPVTHHIYLAYPDGLVTQMNLAAANLAEIPFITLPTAPHGLATAGKYVFMVDGESNWHSSYHPSGTKISTVFGNSYRSEFIWSEANQKMYFFGGNLSAHRINANGTAYTNLAPGAIGATINTLSETFLKVPVRVATDGSVVVLGNGAIYNGNTLARLPVSLTNSIADMTGVNEELKTMRSLGGGTQFQEWNFFAYREGNTRQVPGTPHRLLSLNSNALLAITLQFGRPTFYVMNKQFFITAPPVLSAPAHVNATLMSTTLVTITWSDVSGEETYSIERKLGVDGTWMEHGTALASSTNFSDATVVVGNVYYYRLIARNGATESAPSAEVVAALFSPESPANISAWTLSSAAIRVDWNNVQNESGFLVERRTGPTGTWTQAAIVAANTLSFIDRSLTPDTDYYYRVRATNAVGVSAYSSVVNAITDIVIPSAPSLYTLHVDTDLVVGVQWSDVSYEDNYFVERRTATNGAWSLLVTRARNFTYYGDRSALPGAYYEYRVYATNRAGVSAFSNIRSVTIPLETAPQSTHLFARTVSASSVLLSWYDVARETGYRLQRRTEDPASWVPVATVSSNVTSCVVSNLVEGVQYFFRVQAFNDVGDSLFSNEAAAIPFEVFRFIEDDFDPALNPLAWRSIEGGVATNGGPGFADSNALWFGASGTRAATTLSLDTSRGVSIDFQIRFGNEFHDGNAFWNNSEEGEDVVLEFSTDNGTTWSLLQTFYPWLMWWTTWSFDLPAAAKHPQTQFRWRQLSHSEMSHDTWALEDVVITGGAPQPPATPAFILSSPVSSTSIALSWSESIRTTAYGVDRKIDSGDWQPVATVPGYETNLIDSAALPGTAYSYRVKSMNAGGSSGYSATSTTVTWTQRRQWIYDNYGNSSALSESEMEQPGSDGTLPLLRFAFNLDANEPMQPLDVQPKGAPSIWLDRNSGRLNVEFVRRKASTNPGITYTVQFAAGFSDWTSISELISVTSIDGTWERVRYRDLLEQQLARFCRVAVQPE